MALNINTATADELKLLNGIKEKRAKIIFEMREKTRNGLEADDLLAIPDLSSAIRNLVRAKQITFLPLHNVDSQTRPDVMGLVEDGVDGGGPDGGGPNHQQLVEVMPPLGPQQDVLEAPGAGPPQVNVNASYSVAVEEGLLTELVERLNAALKGKKESDMSLIPGNLEEKLIPHGVNLLKKLDIRIQQLEANDYSQSLSHIQHVEERLIILEENSKLEYLNEKNYSQISKFGNKL